MQKEKEKSVYTSWNCLFYLKTNKQTKKYCSNENCPKIGFICFMHNILFFLYDHYDLDMIHPSASNESVLNLNNRARVLISKHWAEQMMPEEHRQCLSLMKRGTHRSFVKNTADSQCCNTAKLIKPTHIHERSHPRLF